MGIRHSICVAALAAATLAASTFPSQASPWAEVGDSQLLSDIQLLSATGAVNDVTTHWPLPWQSILENLETASLADQPAAVRLAAERVAARARGETATGAAAGLYAELTNRASLVRGFGAMGRGEAQGQVSLGYNLPNISGRLSVGLLAQDLERENYKLLFEGSYLSAKTGEALVYAGYLDHWWGPGQVSALSLSNNARPMPQVGIQRASTDASNWPVLRWLGPWQAEFLLGYFDGPRIQSDTYYNALRVSFNPVPGLEIGLSRTQMFCGQGHPCVPLRDYFDFRNDDASVNRTNDQGAFDIKYADQFGATPWQVYVQVMNEDSSPIVDSGSSHLFGASIFVPMESDPLKLTVEYADSIPARDIFNFGDRQYGFAYNNSRYPDGMRYRGRTLGFSLDSDSTLLSIQASWTDTNSVFYELNLHHGTIGTAQAPGANVITFLPMKFNMAEARVTLPWGGLKFDIAGRMQDKQPFPDRGFTAAIQVALRAPL